jgi:glycosyltransferase involved in cell wall biosynthesis
MAGSKEIAIDARWLHSGLGTYIYNLIKKLPDHTDGWSIRGIIRARDADRIMPLCDRVRFVNAPLYSWREQVQIPVAALGADLLHVPHYNVPVLYRGPLVVTIHDLTHITEPAFRRTLGSWLYARPMLRLAARRAGHVITVSEFSKKQIVERLGIRAERVSVIYNGVGSEFRPMDHRGASAAAEPALQLGGPYVLYVGNLKPHKNLGTLVRALARLRSSERFKHILWVVGDDPRGRQIFLALCERLGLSGAVRHVPWVSEGVLPQLYAAADLLVLPSTSEGFGLPLLEAMSCGTPVVCSSAASLPEVGGDAVIYFDPYSVEEMAAAIKRVLDSPSLRAELRERGLKRAAKFTWEECARKHMDVYRRVLAQ